MMTTIAVADIKVNVNPVPELRNRRGHTWERWFRPAEVETVTVTAGVEALAETVIVEEVSVSVSVSVAVPAEHNDEVPVMRYGRKGSVIHSAKPVAESDTGASVLMMDIASVPAADILTLHEATEVSYEEVGEVLGLPAPVAVACLSRADVLTLASHHGMKVKSKTTKAAGVEFLHALNIITV